MNIKSLLLGSAAALVAVSGARAADVIVADPEPVEYVRVCDAYGTGFFYIPGTETCIKIGGYVRYEISFGRDYEFVQTLPGPAFAPGRGYTSYGDSKNARGQLEVDVREETEYGTLRGFIALQGNSGPSVARPVVLDAAYIELGGLHIGVSDNAFDAGINGEFDALGGAKVNRIAYTFSSGAFDATISIDDDGDVIAGAAAFPTAATATTYGTSGADFVPNVSANIGGTFGAFTARLYGAYDNDTNNYAIKGIVGIDVTSSGHLDLAAYYTDGPTYVLGQQQMFVPPGTNGWTGYASSTGFWGEWSVAASYMHTFNPKLAVTLGGQYIGNWQYLDTILPAGVPSGAEANAWRIGTVIDYNITDNFAAKLAINYTKVDGNAAVNFNGPATTDLDFWHGFLRFQRSF